MCKINYFDLVFVQNELHGRHVLIQLSYYCLSTRVSTAYQDSKGTSRVRRTYVNIAHTPNTPRCYGLLFLHQKIVACTWQVRYAVHTSQIYRPYGSNLAGAQQIRSSYSGYATRTSGLTCHVAVTYAQCTFRICYACVTCVWGILDFLIASTAYQRRTCGVSQLTIYILSKIKKNVKHFLLKKK